MGRNTLGGEGASTGVAWRRLLEGVSAFCLFAGLVGTARLLPVRSCQERLRAAIVSVNVSSEKGAKGCQVKMIRLTVEKMGFISASNLSLEGAPFWTIVRRRMRGTPKDTGMEGAPQSQPPRGRQFLL